MTTRRDRSKSSELCTRNVQAGMTVVMSSSNPEPSPFLMGVLATELENVVKMLSPNTSQRSYGKDTY